MRKYLLALILCIAVMKIQAQKTDPWTEYMMPAEVHKMLQEYTGDFAMEITMWMTPDAEPAIVNVTSSNKMILGGRFLEMRQTGDMMGMDFQSLTTIGFNNSNRSFALTTVTNMGTGVLSLTGSGSDNYKMVNLTGQITNPITKNPINVRQQISFIDSNTLLIENFDQEGTEKERKSIQYKLLRKK